MGRLRRPRLRRWQVVEGLIKKNGWRKGTELGVFRGDTFLHLLATCPDLSLVGIDLWKPMPAKARLVGGRSYADHDLEDYYERLKLRAQAYEGRACLVRMDTVEAAAMVPDRSLDFVWIDADHTYKGVKTDIAAWRPKIRPGGTMLGHDYNEKDFPGVIKAVNEAFGPPDLHPCHVWSVPLPD